MIGTMNFGFSGEMIFIFLLALILFGPKKMPEIGRQVARILNEFRRASNEFRSQIESEVNSLEMSGKEMSGKSASQPTSRVLPPVKDQLGSLASRILNPASAEQSVAEKSGAESMVRTPVAAPEGAIATAAPVAAGAAEPSPIPKVAADA
jgi:sec-independent protein translocase protein TatB